MSGSTSVSERRFPASHSKPTSRWWPRHSVSERRFPASHSVRITTARDFRVYPSGDSLQATAVMATARGAV